MIDVPLIETEDQIEELHKRIDVLTIADLERTVKGEKKYNSSWRKRGGWEATANITRKIDRIETALKKCNWDIFQAILEHPASDGTVDGKDGLLDDIRDLRVYLLLTDDVVMSFLVPKLKEMTNEQHTEETTP